jgi:phage shock protein PspC (stress-responsive transcriptional regulator)
VGRRLAVTLAVATLATVVHYVVAWLKLGVE